MTRRDHELALTGARNALAKRENLRDTAERERDAAIRRAVEGGLSYQDVGDLVGLSKARVSQIAAVEPVPAGDGVLPDEVEVVVEPVESIDDAIAAQDAINAANAAELAERERAAEPVKPPRKAPAKKRTSSSRKGVRS